MRKVFLLLLTMISISVYSTNFKLKIYVASNGCINCYGEFIYLAALPNSVDLEIIAQNGYKEYIKEFLSNYSIKHKYTIIEDTKFDGQNSICELYQKNECIVQSSFSDIGNVISNIRLLTSKYVLTDSITNKFTANNSIVSYIDNNKIFLYNYLLNKVDIFDKNTKEFSEIKGSSFSAQKILSATYDTAIYNKYEYALVRMGLDKPHIASAIIHNDTTIIEIGVKYPEEDSNKNIGFNEIRYIGNFVNNKLVALKHLDYNILYHNDSYLLNNNFIKVNNTLFTGVLKQKVGNENNLLAKWDETKDSLLFLGYSKQQIPSKFLTDKLYRYTNINVRNNLFFFENYPLYYSMKKNKFIDYSSASIFKNLNVGDFYVSGLVENNNLITLLYKYKKEYRTAIINTTNMKVITDKKLDLPARNYYLMDTNLLVGFSINFNKIFLYKSQNLN